MASVTSFSASLSVKAAPRSSPPWLASTTAKKRRALAGVVGIDGITGIGATLAGAIGGVGIWVWFWAVGGAAVMVIVRRSLLKLAMSEALRVTINSAAPLFSW